jgi:hypothetical protein
MYDDAGAAADAVPPQITGDVVYVVLGGGFLAAGAFDGSVASVLPRQALDISGDIIGLRAGQCEIHLGVRSDQVENQRSAGNRKVKRCWRIRFQSPG